MCEIIDFLSEKRLSKYGDINKPETIKEYFFNVNFMKVFTRC